MTVPAGCWQTHSQRIEVMCVCVCVGWVGEDVGTSVFWTSGSTFLTVGGVQLRKTLWPSESKKSAPWFQSLCLWSESQVCASSSGWCSEGRNTIPIEIVVNTCSQQLCTLVGAWHLLLCLTHRVLKEAARFVFLVAQRFAPDMLCVCAMHLVFSVISFKGVNLKKKMRRKKKCRTTQNMLTQTQEITHQPDLAAWRAAHKAAGNIYSLLRTFEMNSRCVCDFGTVQHVHPDPSRHWASSALCFRTPRPHRLETHTHTLPSPSSHLSSHTSCLMMFCPRFLSKWRKKEKKRKQNKHPSQGTRSSPTPLILSKKNIFRSSLKSNPNLLWGCCFLAFNPQIGCFCLNLVILLFHIFSTPKACSHVFLYFQRFYQRWYLKYCKSHGSFTEQSTVSMSFYVHSRFGTGTLDRMTCG